MTVTQDLYVILAALGIVAVALLVAFLFRYRPTVPTPDAPSSPPLLTETPRPSHNPHVSLVHRTELGEIEDHELLANGMLDPANHMLIGAYLSRGSDHGVRWNDGHIEWGAE